MLLKIQKNTVLTRDITNENGAFKVGKIPAGENIIEIQYIGYKTTRIKISFTRKNTIHNIGIISLTEDVA